MPGMTDAPVVYRCLRWVLPRTLVPYLPIEFEGIDHVPQDQPFILAANHLSFIDSLVIPMRLTQPLYYLAKYDYFESWRTRWFFRAVGTVPTRRGSNAGTAALEAGVEILRSGDPIGIYPEGTRSPDGRLYRGKTGPVRMALEADVPIVPVGLIGTDRVQPTGSYGIRRHPVTMRVGRPLDLSRYGGDRGDPFALRAATDELMFEIMMLTGQEYVDEYAARVKGGDVEVPDATDGNDTPGAMQDTPVRDQRRAAG